MGISADRPITSNSEHCSTQTLFFQLIRTPWKNIYLRAGTDKVQDKPRTEHCATVEHLPTQEGKGVPARPSQSPGHGKSSSCQD